MKRPWWRIGCLATVAIAVVLGVGLWLNLPGSLFVLAKTMGDRSHPVKFDLWYAALPKGTTSADVTLTYYPKTPILGISQHYWSIIAPLRVDTVVRTQRVAREAGHFRFDAPLGLVGLSGFRLSWISVHPNGMQPEDAADIGMTTTPDNALPTTLAIPLAHVQNNNYEFGGAIALWRLSGEHSDQAGYTFSPRAPNNTRQVLWDDVRGVRALVDLTHYPVPTFQAPPGWQGFGWKPSGINLAQPGASLSDRTLELRRNMTVRIPFTRDCPAIPWFVTVPASQIPPWSKIDGLWRPVPQGYWLGLVSKPGLTPRFIAAAKPPADGIEALEIHATQPGSFRLFATCLNEHYGSTAMTWLDVTVR